MWELEYLEENQAKSSILHEVLFFPRLKFSCDALCAWRSPFDVYRYCRHWRTYWILIWQLQGEISVRNRPRCICARGTALVASTLERRCGAIQFLMNPFKSRMTLRRIIVVCTDLDHWAAWRDAYDRLCSISALRYVLRPQHESHTHHTQTIRCLHGRSLEGSTLRDVLPLIRLWRKASCWLDWHNAKSHHLVAHDRKSAECDPQQLPFEERWFNTEKMRLRYDRTKGRQTKSRFPQYARDFVLRAVHHRERLCWQREQSPASNICNGTQSNW